MAIDIWCTRCGSNLDWEGEIVPIGPRRRWRLSLSWTAAMAAAGLRRRLLAGVGAARGALGRVARPVARPIAAPRLAPSGTARALLAMGAVVLVAVSVAAFSLAGARSSPPSQRLGSRLGSRPPSPAAGSALAAALPAVQATSGVRFSFGSCQPGRCLRFTGEVDGLNAAAVEFSLGDGRACAAYLTKERGAWQAVAARCAPAAQLAPMVGRKDTVHVPGNCANVRNSASLSGSVVACLGDGTAVTLDAGPDAGAGHLWWHLRGLGWMAQEFLLR